METMGVYCENRTKHTNITRARMQSATILKQVVHMEPPGFGGLILS
jgi:hypothetical protein